MAVLNIIVNFLNISEHFENKTSVLFDNEKKLQYLRILGNVSGFFISMSSPSRCLTGWHCQSQPTARSSFPFFP